LFAAQTSKPNLDQDNIRRAVGGDSAIDLAHLARQTDGDNALAAELLAMFDAQAARIAPELRQNDLGAQARANIAHQLKGSALAVGAHRVAASAEAVEKHFARLAADAAACKAPLDALDRAVEEARVEIARLSP
jgi:HPt (histidine-containing phosphotransfer) domain-containing protein